MNHRQHISTHLNRVMRVLLPGGLSQLGQRSSRLLAELCEAEPVAIRAMKHQVMPRCLDAKPVYRRTRKA